MIHSNNSFRILTLYGGKKRKKKKEKKDMDLSSRRRWLPTPHHTTPNLVVLLFQIKRKYVKFLDDGIGWVCHLEFFHTSKWKVERDSHGKWQSHSLLDHDQVNGHKWG